MNVLRCLGERFFKKTTSVFLVFLSVAACAAEKGYPEKLPVPSEPGPLKEINLTINVNGDLIIKDNRGKPIGDKCSSDPKAPDVCPIFESGHKVQIEDVSSAFIIKYSGSPSCYYINVNGVVYVLPSAAYCKK